MDSIFICHTTYHLLISLIKAQKGKNNYFLLSESIPNSMSIKSKLKNLDFIEDCLIIQKDCFKSLLDGLRSIYIYIMIVQK